MAYRIRRVETAQDISTVAELASHIWQAHYMSLIGAEQVAYMLSQFQSEPAIQQQCQQGMTYVLVEKGAPRSYGHFSFQWRVSDSSTALASTEAIGYAAYASVSGETLHLSKLYVRPAYQGCGAGKALLNHVEESALGSGTECLELTVNRSNVSALHWYQRQGFVKKEAAKKPIGQGFYMDDWVMEKVLVAPKR